jgi:hypothetical protein
MARLALTLACGAYDRMRAITTGEVRPDGVELNVVTLAPEEMFYRMARFREFDVSELSLSTYTVLRGRGEPLVAIPVFPSFSFRHSSIFVGAAAGIATPKDLVGKRVGVPKYHMTAAVWIRGMLEDEYGVAPRDMLWFEGGEGSKVMHTLVLKEELARQHPWLPRSLYDAFVESKRLAYERLQFTAALPVSLPWLVAEVEETRALMGDDPFPLRRGA